jgi:hypothetical protein
MRLDSFDDILQASFRVENGKLVYGKDQLKELLGRALFLLRFYGLKKASIPTESYWFKRTYRQLNWFTSNSTVTDIGMYTGGSLQPETVPDQMWFEKELAAKVLKILSLGLEAQDRLLISNFFSTIQQYTEKFAQEQSTEIAFFLLDIIRPISRRFLLDVVIGSEDYLNIESGLMVALSIADNYGLVPLSIINGTVKGISSIEPSSLKRAVNKIRWRSTDSIYRLRFPKEMINQLMFIQKGLNAEYYIEGHLTTPDWYILQAANFGAINYISLIPERILNLLREDFVILSTALIEKGRYFLALQIIERGLEACNKCETHFETYQKYYSDFITKQTVATFVAPNLDWGKINASLEECRKQLIENFAQITPFTGTLPEHPSIPDYFGKAYWVISEECLRCIVTDKATLFDKLFPVYFHHVFVAFDRCRGKYRDTNDNFWLIQSMDIMRDLLTISGYAMIYNELGNRAVWSTVERVWDSFVEQHRQAGTLEAILRTVVTVALGRGAFVGVSSKRSVVLMNWMQFVSQDLNRRGLLREDRYGYSLRERNVTYHESPLITYLQQNTSLSLWTSNPDEIFVAFKLLQIMPPTDQDQVNARIGQLIRRIDAIRQARARVVNNDDGENGNA